MINSVQFAARQLKGETAKWSGDYTTRSACSASIRPESGIDWHYFASTAKKEGLKLAEGAEVVYTVPIDTSQAVGEEPGGGTRPRREAEGRGRDHGDAVHLVRR